MNQMNTARRKEINNVSQDDEQQITNLDDEITKKKLDISKDHLFRLK